MRKKNKSYLNHIKGLSCICKDTSYRCDQTIHSHHVKTIGSGGSDYQTVPLCALHHSEVHNIGRETFAQKHAIDWERAQMESLVGYIEMLETLYSDY